MWIGKIRFCLLLCQSITLMSSALNRTQAVRLCLFCDHRNRGNTPQAKHIFPHFFHFPWLFHDHCQIPWLFRVFQIGGRPEFKGRNDMVQLHNTNNVLTKSMDNFYRARASFAVSSTVCIFGKVHYYITTAKPGVSNTRPVSRPFEALDRLNSTSKTLTINVSSK